MYFAELVERFPELKPAEGPLRSAFEMVRGSLAAGGLLMVCGNGGSCADADHIVGELMKSFLRPRPCDPGTASRLEALFGAEGRAVASRLERGLRAVSLCAHHALLSAFANDVDASLVYAQQLYGLAKPGDVLLGLSTSGNAANVLAALRVAKALGVGSVLLTGGDGGLCAAVADVSVKVPARGAGRVQELHLPIYHALCAQLEEAFYGGGR